MNLTKSIVVLEPKASDSRNQGAFVTLRKLSDRELEVIELICQELSPGEISGLLNISEKTYFNHRSSILQKTGARGNIGIYKFALQNGFAS